MYNRDLWVPATIFTFITHNQNYHHVCVGILAVAGCLRWLQYKLLFVCDKWTWRKTPPQNYGYLFKGGLHSNQQIHRRDYLFRGTRRCKKKGPLTFIHSLLAADTQQHKRWMNWTWWTGSRYVEVVPLLILKHGWWWGQCLVERGISANQLEAFFLYRLMKIIVECCRMISWLDLKGFLTSQKLRNM